jgi:hypothetical protein
LVRSVIQEHVKMAFQLAEKKFVSVTGLEAYQ